ncbi:MAG: hypothetical protein P8O85_00845 [Yoonia sp.]|jgi:hypothetical protein|nr:hypothetical protein [Yoonia sp.]MDG1803073.1 hypothetical protein [Paracoccaceae bacterium]
MNLTLSNRLRAVPELGTAQCALPWGGSGEARRIRLAALSFLVILPNSTLAQAFEPLDQFRVVAIPSGVDLEPSTPNAAVRRFSFKTGVFSRFELEDFSKAICNSERVIVEQLDRSLIQKLTRTNPVRVTC